MSARSFRILLIEDNPGDAELVRQILTKTGLLSFQIEHADRFAIGLELLARMGGDVVLLDLNLPDGHGLDLVDRLRAQAPAVPIVVLTGTYEDEELGIQALQKGAQDYLLKDHLDAHGLIRAIRYAIERKRIEEELRVLNADLKQKIKNIEWLNQIMMDRENRILELKEQVRVFQAKIQKTDPQ